MDRVGPRMAFVLAATGLLGPVVGLVCACGSLLGVTSDDPDPNRLPSAEAGTVDGGTDGPRDASDAAAPGADAREDAEGGGVACVDSVCDGGAACCSNACSSRFQCEACISTNGNGECDPMVVSEVCCLPSTCQATSAVGFNYLCAPCVRAGAQVHTNDTCAVCCSRQCSGTSNICL
jgi:hypothetical protein